MGRCSCPEVRNGARSVRVNDAGQCARLRDTVLVETGDAVEDVTIAELRPETSVDAVTGMETNCSAPLASLPIVTMTWLPCSVVVEQIGRAHV